MKVKRYLTPFLPIVAILFSFQLYNYIKQLTTGYMQTVNDNYSIILIAKSPLEKAIAKSLIPDMIHFEAIDTNGSLEQFKMVLSQQYFDDLVGSIPHFYQVRLDNFPNASALEQIKIKTQAHSNIIKTETFLGRYSSFSLLLVNTELMITIFTAIVFILGIVLLVKLTRIWYQEHANRMEVMQLFGASLLECSQTLFQIALVNAVVASIVVSGAFAYMHGYFLNTFETMGLQTHFDFAQQVLYNFAIALGISLMSLTYMIIRQK